MMRNLKILFLSLMIVGLTVSLAFAGATNVTSGGVNATQIMVSLEATGAARNVTLTGAGAAGNTVATAPLSYTAAQPLVANNLLVVTFTNVGFTGGALNVCAMNGAADVQVGNATPTAGATTFNFQLNGATDANFGSGNSAYFTSAGCGAAAGNLPIQIAAGASTRLGTVKVDAITSGSVVIDTSTAQTIANIRPEYAVGNNVTFHTIDYLGTPGNGTRIISAAANAPNLIADSLAAGSTNIAAITRTANDYNVNIGAQNAGLTASATLSLVDSAAWQGMSRVYLMDNNIICAFAANKVANTSPSGIVTLNIPAGAGAGNFNGTIGNAWNLCAEVNGTSSLQTRGITASVDVNVTGVGSNDPIASAATAAQTWGLNAYQGVIPWVVNASSMPTYCLINSAEPTRTANVILDVVSSEGAVTLLNQSLGSIAPLTSVLAVFTANSATLGTGTPVSLTTLGTDRRYASRVTVTANPNNIYIACVQTDPISGAKRAVPVLTNAFFWNQ